MKQAWLSIDFDFWARIEDEWDWGFSEGPFWRDGPMWTIRAAHMRAEGKDIVKEMVPSKVTPLAADFWTFLQDVGVKIPLGCPIGIADSHAWGVGFFGKMPTAPADRLVLHFDAHHDLGYEPRASQEETTVDGGNWLLKLMLMRKKLEAHILYPEWKGYREIDKGECRYKTILPGRVVPDIVTLATLKNVVPKDTVVKGIFISRSGSWSPPWADEAFISFVQTAHYCAGGPLERFDIDQEDLDVMVPRVFDWGVVEREAARLKTVWGGSPVQAVP